MKTTRTTKTIVIAAVLLIAGTTFAFARGGWNDDGYGYGRHMGDYGGGMMGPGYAGHHMMGPGRGFAPGNNNLTDEEVAKIDAAREKFFDETRSLKRDIDDKAYDLRKALNSENPDANKVAGLQKELSKLQADFDLKAVQHRLEMRKILPEKKLQGRGMGVGRGGYCWRN